MWGFIVIILGSIIPAGVWTVVCVSYAKKITAESDRTQEIYSEAIDERRQILERIATFKKHLVSVQSLREKVETTIELSDVIQAERGRSAITQVELETVELRLRELEEIERELEASEQETREELRVLKRREEELRAKNEELKSRISESKQLLEQLLSEIQVSEATRRSLERMQEELEMVEEQVGDLLDQISKGNDQYFSLKRRYDALDIEYAQLYEKFIGD